MSVNDMMEACSGAAQCPESRTGALARTSFVSLLTVSLQTVLISLIIKRHHPFMVSLTFVFLLSRWLVKPNMMSESTKIVPRSMTLGLGFPASGDPCEFGKAMPAVCTAYRIFHSLGNLLDFSIHQIHKSRTPLKNPQWFLIRTFGDTRWVLARVRKITSQISSTPRRKKKYNPLGMQSCFISTEILFKTSSGIRHAWCRCAAAGLRARKGAPCASAAHWSPVSPPIPPSLSPLTQPSPLSLSLSPYLSFSLPCQALMTSSPTRFAGASLSSPAWRC